VSRRQHGAGWLFAQDQAPVVEGDEKRGVGLPAADGLELHRPLQARQSIAPELLEPLGLKPPG
jgi:hypothetical protein